MNKDKHSALFPFALSALGNISAFLGLCGQIPISLTNLRFMEKL